VQEIPYGYCKCGCGEKTKLRPASDINRGYTKGEPRDFIKDHKIKAHTGNLHPSWGGGKSVIGNYVVIHSPNHPRHDTRNYVYEHILVMEEHLGRFLVDGEVVHHVNRNTKDNKIENLMLFANNSEHKTYHRKEDAFNACGNSDWRKCTFCKQYDDVKNLKVRFASSCYHPECGRIESKRRYDAGLCIRKPK
jgi:hypothetical protein